MTHSYQISGMTCNSCVAKVKSQLLQLGDVTEATVQLTYPQATLTMLRHISIARLQEAVGKAGLYTITDADAGATAMEAADRAPVSYKPLLLVAAYITGISLLAALSYGAWDTGRWMRYFMAGFFLAFSFFKLLDLNGFADSYTRYDLVACSWRPWALLYPFVELGLGVLFLLNSFPFLTNVITLVVMSISSMGVIRSLVRKQQIQCACLGAVFNLPMSTVTLVEDGLMIAMSGVMLWQGGW